MFAKDGSKFLKRSSFGSTNIAVSGTSDRPTDSITGDIRFNTDNTVLEYYDGSAWKDIAKSSNVTINKSTPVTGNGIDTAFTNFFTTAPSDENNVIVVVGNVIQEPDQAYTISGRDITFASPPPNTHRIYAFEGLDSTNVS